MIPLLRYWLDLCLFRAAPQDGPASGVLLAMAMAAYLLSSLVSMAGSYGLSAAWMMSITGLCLMVMLVTSLLYLAGLAARVPQTLSALAGAGTLLNLASIVLVSVTGPAMSGDRMPLLLALAWLGLLLWQLAVTAHILRHALSQSLAVGLGVALVYILISIQVVNLLMPGLGESPGG